MLGGAFGAGAHVIFPDYTGSVGAYALVGMGTAFAGIVRVPLTSVIMIFEVTRDYSIIVPLMISNMVSYFVSYKLQRQPIYEALAHQEGVQLPGGEAREHFGRMRVAEILEERPGLDAEATAASLREQLRDSPVNAWPVVERGRMVGLLKQTVLGKAPADARAGAIAEREFPFVYSDQPLSLALERMGEGGASLLPVLSRADRSELQGVITLAAVLRAYGVGEGTPPGPGVP
jgi:CIC family chloride channel protein